ncbi:MAG: Tat pathway signal protein [Pseudomonadota bacterium]
MSRYSNQVVALRTAIREPSIEEFIRYATLAANSHNTQPWRFEIVEQGVCIRPDFSRRTPSVDPDDHHLWISLGCAAENFMIAARAHGYVCSKQYDSAMDSAIRIDLEPGPIQADDLYQAIPLRQSTRSHYDGRAVSKDNLTRLQLTLTMDGVSARFLTEPSQLEVLARFVARANDVQFDDAVFMQELKYWLRFNSREAEAHADGLFSGCTGNPSIPGWLGRGLFSLLLRKKAARKQYVEQIQSSAGVVVFMADRADPAHWIQVGRSFQRFALQATALGIRHAHINQPIEVPSLRPLFAHALGLGDMRPDLVIRFGYAEPMPMSVRRPVEDVLAVAE